MSKTHLPLALFLMLGCVRYGTTVSHTPFRSELHNSDYYAQPPASHENPVFEQANSNYEQIDRYYYTPPYKHQQLLLPQQPTQLWSGRPIVVQEDIQQQQPSSTNIPPTFYQQQSTANIIRNSELLPFVHRNSKVLPPAVYYPQSTTRTNPFSYNSNNIVYHKDFRNQFDGVPESQYAQENIASFKNNQQQQHQQQQQQQGQQQPIYTANTNLRYNGISNYLTSLKEDFVPDYREHFQRYLENNPNRIKPIY